MNLLVETGADAPRREARAILLNYARRLEHTDSGTRRIVAAGLGELTPLLESLWPNQVPEELSKGTLAVLAKEKGPETSALLAAFLETLGRVAVSRGDFSGFENILIGLERVPRDAAHEHLSALGHRLVANDRWMLLVDAALANRALDPTLPRLLQRDPERLLDRLTLLLTDTRGPEMIPAMARLLRAIGVPVLTLLETRLFEARRQRVSAAIKLLAAADPDRLLRGLTRAMASWEWNLQDLAVGAKHRVRLLRDSRRGPSSRRSDDDRSDWRRPGSHRRFPSYGNRRWRTRNPPRHFRPHQSYRSSRPSSRHGIHRTASPARCQTRRPHLRRTRRPPFRR